jgi:hypothetical protein
MSRATNHYRHSLTLGIAETDRPRRCDFCRDEVPSHIVHSRPRPNSEYCVWSAVDEKREHVSQHRGNLARFRGQPDSPGSLVGARIESPVGG